MILNAARKLSQVPFIGKLLRRVYHHFQWAKQIEGDPPLGDTLAYFDRAAATPVYPDRIVDIIIPIYNACEFLERLLASIFANTDVPFQLILVDDASTDCRIEKLLEKVSFEHTNITVLRNSKNRGFVQAVNRGLDASTHDVVIMNTDVEVPPFWLSRLMYPVFELRNVASATPLSNSSTITSFPDLMKSNELFGSMTLADIDAEFRKIKSCESIYIETPTGHGFCMAMSRKALENVGSFDEMTFGRGCGEENDWCMRALRRGFKNVIVTNLYCFHSHTRSFSKEEKKRLTGKHVPLVRKRYPDYLKRIKKTADNDVYRSLRLITLGRLYNRCAPETILCLYSINTFYLGRKAPG